MTYMDRVLQGGEQALIDELVRAVSWARMLKPVEWSYVISSEGGLRGFIEETMRQTVKEEGADG